MGNNKQLLKAIVATSSAIMRSGVAAVLKRLPELNIQAVEINSIDGLMNYVNVQTPDIIIIDPTLGGWFDLAEFKASHDNLSGVKFVAMVASVIDSNQLRDFQETIAIYDNADTIAEKLIKLMESEEEEKDNELEALSQREKEIITFVVKGLTNKEIADKLCLSVHTVITHRRNIARKLQIHSPAGLTIYAIVNKLVELKDIEL